jgi:hypothetical protein
MGTAMPQAVFSEVQAAVAASGGFLQIPDLYINMANVALAKQVGFVCACLLVCTLVLVPCVLPCLCANQ